MKRTKIGKYYVVRRKDGTIKRWTAIGKSLRRDRLKRAIKTVKSGYGHRGDLKRRK